MEKIFNGRLFEEKQYVLEGLAARSLGDYLKF